MAEKSSISFFNYEAKVTVHLERCQAQDKKMIEIWFLKTFLKGKKKKLILKHTKAELKAKSCVAIFPKGKGFGFVCSTCTFA